MLDSERVMTTIKDGEHKAEDSTLPAEKDVGVIGMHVCMEL